MNRSLIVLSVLAVLEMAFPVTPAYPQKQVFEETVVIRNAENIIATMIVAR